jgi:hypothetical protein
LVLPYDLLQTWLLAVTLLLVQELPWQAAGYESLQKETEQQMAQLREKEDALVSSSSSASSSSSSSWAKRSVQPCCPMLCTHLLQLCATV